MPFVLKRIHDIWHGMLIYKLFDNVMQKEICWKFTEIKPVKTAHYHSKFKIFINVNLLEGILSQNCDIGPSLYLRKCSLMMK